MRLVACAIVCSTQLMACGLGYYWQATSGHLSIMRQRRPVEAVLVDPETTEAVRSKLREAAAAVAFAHEQLLLPDNGSYQSYADIGRQYVVWNVVAAPEFSLQPRTWCFPVAGCVSYRGYFREDAAQNFAAGLDGAGHDIHVGGVAAYSTLGRFADPLLNTMMAFPDYHLVGLIFHELAHQLVYAKDDSKFNEGFASFVEEEGIYRWLRFRGDHHGLCAYRLFAERRQQVLALVILARKQLEALYAQDIHEEQMRAKKQDALHALKAAYRVLRGSWTGPPYFDHWFGESLNNARLAALATYDDYVPAFAHLLWQNADDLTAFYAQVKHLASLTAAQRELEMQALLGNAARVMDYNDQRVGDTCPEVSST